MWLVLASLLLSTAQADDRDCVTTDYAWRVHTTDGGSTWRVVHSGSVLTDQGKLDVAWHEDTKKRFTSTDPAMSLFAVEATVKHPEGKPVAEGLSGEQRLELRCAASSGGAPAAKAPPPAKAPPKAAPPATKAPPAVKVTPPPAKAPPAPPAPPATPGTPAKPSAPPKEGS